MNSTDKYDNDILKQYLNAESAEKAPEDFTCNVMTKIQPELEPLKVNGKLHTVKILPAIAAIFILTLIIIAVNIPGNDRESLSLINMLQNVDFSDLNTSFKALLNLDLPGLLTYLCVGILFLGIFDVALNGLFHRERR
jgi:hypothetical protein